MTKILQLLIVSIVFLTLLTLPQTGYAKSPDKTSTELVVTYKQNQSPDELTQQVNLRRQTLQKTPFGIAVRFFEDLVLRLHGDRPPEDKLQDLQNIQTQLHVIESKSISRQTDPVAKQLGLQSVHIVKTDGTKPIGNVSAEYKAIPEVQSVESNSIVKAMFAANDASNSAQWALSKINIDNAWDIATGSSDVTIAVIDTGIDYTHPDLPSDIIRGYNFISSNYSPMDDYGHGTHVAGILGATTNNGIGISGINHRAKLMAVKVLDNTGVGYLTDVALGIIYAVQNNAKVINLSLGSSGLACPDYLQTVLDYAYESNVTVVVASGEDTPISNQDVTKVIFASCNHVLSVAASQQNDQRASYSNYGTAIDIAAPGGEGGCAIASCSILSTLPNNQYGLLNGTSMATPHVAGVAALMLSRNLTLTPDQVKSIIKSTADILTTDHPIGNRLNAYQALLATPLRTPVPTAAVSSNSATISWSIPEATTSSKLDYGWSTSYDLATATYDTSPMVYNHSIDLGGFAPCESFHYKTTSVDFWNFSTSSVDTTFTTSGCTVNSTVLDEKGTTLASASGGTTSLLSSGLGLTLTVPPTAATADANFQIKQLDKTQSLAITSTPNGKSLVGNYIYELKAFADLTTPISAFSLPLTVDVTYSSPDISGIDESTLAIYQWDGSGWTQLTGCSTNVSTKKVSCQTSNFSAFGLFGQGNIASSNNSSTSSTACTDSPPVNAPNLFQIDSDSTHAKLYFSPVTNNLSYYFIAYGYDQNDMRFGVSYNATSATGVQSYTINSLAPNSTYYFKVRGGNGCSTGYWGNTLSTKTTSSSNVVLAQYSNGQSSTINNSSGLLSNGASLNTVDNTAQTSELDASVSAERKANMKPPGAFETTVGVGLAGTIITVIGIALLAL